MENDKKMGHYISQGFKEETRPIVFRSKHLDKRIVVSDFKYRLVNEHTCMLNAKVQVGDDAQTYICINIPEKVDFLKIVKLEVFQALDKLEKYDNLSEKKYNHLGTIGVEHVQTKKLFRKEEHDKYYIVPPTDQQLRYAEQHLDPLIPAENTEEVEKQTEKLEDKKQKEQEEFRDKVKEQYEQYREKQSEKIKERIANPELKVTNIKVEKIGDEEYEKYMYYEGTDLQTGKTLELNKTHYKQIDGKYIYTGYVNRPSEQKFEIRKELDDRPQGYPVIFELPKSINEFMKKQDIAPILKILQKDKNMEIRNNHVNFLGRVTITGEIQRETVSSKAISNGILQEVKDEFYKEVKRRRQEREIEQEEKLKLQEEQNKEK